MWIAPKGRFEIVPDEPQVTEMNRKPSTYMTGRERFGAEIMKRPRATRVLANPNAVVTEDILEHLALVNETRMESNNTASGKPILSPGPAYVSKVPQLEETVVAVAAGTIDQPKYGMAVTTQTRLS
ncbi:unnamed protein product [Echinostoma caproni]|uniref:Phage major capsid protein n=1 Tax=Echinostoma caproni TaxID=27848 RepID=A0A183B2G8_9TREM|nr:unnamed protein product [Echinostoma caproni]